MVDSGNIKYLEKEIQEIYKELHQYPELAFHETRTSELILSKLQEWGIEAQLVMLTGVIGTIYGAKPGRTVAIRADIDALPIEEAVDVPYCSRVPGKMHACGHDAHVAMLLGAAKYFQDHRGELTGNVRLVFQPGEEGWEPEDMERLLAAGGSERGGADSMVKAGALQDVDIMFALHVDPTKRTGQLSLCDGPACAAADQFQLTITGKGGHGANPEKAIDPMPALAEILTAYHSLPAREFGALDQCVVTVGTVNTASTWNSIADSVHLSGTFRTFDEEIRKRIRNRLEEIAGHVAAAHRCTVAFTHIPDFDATVNEKQAVGYMYRTAAEVLGEENVEIVPPRMGAEDLCYFFEHVSGVIGYVGVAEDGYDLVALHSPRLKVDLQALSIGMLLHINNVYNYLSEVDA